MYNISYRMSIDVEINLAVGKINFVLPNFISSTFNTCIKNSQCLHFNIKLYFSNNTKTITCPSTNFQDQSIQQSGQLHDLAYEGFISSLIVLG